MRRCSPLPLRPLPRVALGLANQRVRPGPRPGYGRPWRPPSFLAGVGFCGGGSVGLTVALVVEVDLVADDRVAEIVGHERG